MIISEFQDRQKKTAACFDELVTTILSLSSNLISFNSFTLRVVVDVSGLPVGPTKVP